MTSHVVVIPALDEVATIGEVVTALLGAGHVDVVVVDNGSQDATGAAAEAAGARVVTERRRGYGYACAAGAAAAEALGAEVIVFMDGDGSSSAIEVDRLLAPLADGEADLVQGSRRLGSIAGGAMPAHQRIGNRFAAAAIRVLHGTTVTDLGPFRAIRTSLLRELDMREMTYGWPTEMTVKAVLARAAVVEVPVTWSNRLAGRSKVGGTVRGSLLAAWHIGRVTVALVPRRVRSRVRA